MAKYVRGIYVAANTPMDSQQELRLELIPNYVDYLINSQMDGVYAVGSTGEFPHLTVDERKQLQKKWLDCSQGRKLEVIMQVGASNIKDTVELAKHARANGAKAIATVPPFYFPLSNVECCIRWLEAVQNAVPDVDLFYYHIPFTTNASYTLYDVLTAGRERLPNLVGAKFTDTDVAQLIRCTQLKNKSGENYVILPGFEEIYLPNLSAGAHGLIVSNFMPKEFVAIRAAFEAGDMATARVHQARVVEIMTLLRKFAKDHNTDFFGTLKDVMRVVGRKRLGFDVGPARTPLLALPEDKLPELEAALNSIGFFSW